MAAVDIVIPLYNTASTVGRTIESILAQTFTDWQALVIDDGSTDDSVKVVSEFEDKRIRIISQENQGPGAARNRGIREATADYVAFLDADDEWYHWYLANAMAAFQANPIALVGSLFYEWPKEVDMTAYWARRGVVPGTYSIDPQTPPEQIESWFLFFHVGTTVVKTDIARKYEGFYEERCVTGEDTIFFARLVLNERFGVIGPPAVRHNRQDSALSSVHHHPLTPALTHPEVVLDYCPPDKRQAARLALALLALRTAHHKARNGFKDQARQLLRDFPEMRTFGWRYYKCRLEVLLSRWMPWWVKFKVKTGPPTRLFLRKIGYKIGLLKTPPTMK